MTSLSTHGVYTPQHLPANRSNIPHPLFYVLQNCIGLTCLQTSDIPHPLFCVLQNFISLTCLQTGATFHTPYSTIYKIVLFFTCLQTGATFHTPCSVFYKIVLFLLACKQEQHSTPLVPVSYTHLTLPTSSTV